MQANGDIYLDKYAGWYSVRDEAYYDESETRIDDKGAARRPPGHAGRMGRGGELFLPPVRLSGQAPRPLRERPELRAAEGAPQRGRKLRARRPEGSVDLAHDLRLGRQGAGRSPAHDVCVGRRAHQLHHRRRLSRYRQREIPPLLAGRPARDRQGHRALPRGVLAGVPDVGRRRRAAPHLLPRLSVQPRREDVEVGRQRHRSVCARQGLRRRSAALFLPARGAVRAGRQLQPRGDRQPHQRRSRQRSRQSGAALADDGGAQFRRRAARAGAAECGRPGDSCRRRRHDRQGARGDGDAAIAPGAQCGMGRGRRDEPLFRRRGALGARQDRSGTAGHHPLCDRGGVAADRDPGAAVHAGLSGRGCSIFWRCPPANATSPSSAASTASPPAANCRRRRRSFPAMSSRKPARPNRSQQKC